MSEMPAGSLPILLLTATSRDAAIARDFLATESIPGLICAGAREMSEHIRLREVGALVVAREMLSQETVPQLLEALSNQPAWSQIPLIVLASPQEGERLLSQNVFATVTGALIVERPLHLRTFLNVIQAVLRDRQRQMHMRDLLDAMNRFTSTVAHDLKEPLRTVSTYLQLFLRERPEAISAESTSLIESAFEGTRRMHRLIDSLLLYARAADQELRREMVAFGEIVDEAKKNLRQAIADSRARIECGELPPACVDRVQLVQVVQNLIGNAIKFQRGGIPTITIESMTDEHECIIRIKDNGIGIDSEFAEQIFSPFKRLHSEDEFPGSGIGLATCRRIIQRHGGRLWVESTKGVGSIFSFAIPHNPKRFAFPQSAQEG